MKLKFLLLFRVHSTDVYKRQMVHLGTLIAVLIFFRKDIAEILKSMWDALKSQDWSDKKAKLGLYIALGTVITVALALPCLLYTSRCV